MIKIINYKKFYIEILKGLIKLIIAGVLIGYLKSYDLIIALLLLLKVIYELNKSVFKPKQKNWILLLGMFLTGFAGIIGEFWGVSSGYWEYHEVSRKLPLWIPFAWMLAFNFLYRLEYNLISILKKPTFSQKIIVAILLALIFPAIGEMITIALGVWTYYWPYQLFGVPLFAFLCLVFIHMLIYYILHIICKRQQIKDIVFY